MNKHNCIKCRNKAIWYYVPYYKGRIEKDNYYCDNCVKRGCSCNILPGETEELRDELGRLLPCCEYDWNGKGYDKMNLQTISTAIEQYAQKPVVKWVFLIFTFLLGALFWVLPAPVDCILFFVWLAPMVYMVKKVYGW